MISDKQRKALFINLHRAIDEAVTYTIDNLTTPKDLNLAYPPNSGLTEEEIKAVEALQMDQTLKNALEKILADAASYPVFRLLSLIDGVSDPVGLDEFWPGFILEPKEDDEDLNDSFLHDEFFDTYWDWIGLNSKTD